MECRRTSALVSACLGGILAVACGCGRSPEAAPILPQVVATPTPAPPLASVAEASSSWNPVWTDVNGLERRPLADPAVQAVVLVFLMHDCPIANSYLPELNRLHETWRPRGVELLLMQVDPILTAEAARTHATEYRLAPPVVLDADHAWVKRAGATRSPEAAVFSRQGEVLYRGRIDDQYVGFGKRRPQAGTHDLRDAVEAILAGQPVPPGAPAVGCYIPDR